MKCYRCNLTFTAEHQATMHERLTDHTVERSNFEGSYSRAFKYVVGKFFD